MRPVTIFATALALVHLLGASRQSPDSFRFIHITDTHLTATGNTQPLKDLVATVNAMDPKPAFVVDTGDVTEAG
jgi:hypothetical protein